MGYYTRYSLETDANDATVEDAILTRIKELSGYNYGPFEDECKWYSFDKDMIAVSKEFPDVLFTLYGEGEESGDVWKAQYKNGLTASVKANLVYPEMPELK